VTIQNNVTGRKVFASDAPKARRVPEACRAIGISKAMLYKLAAQGKIRLVHIGGRTVVPEAEIDRLARKGRLNVVAPKAKEPGGGSAPPARFQADRIDGRIAARAFANAYSALLAIDAYTETAREAFRGDDDGDACHCLAVIAAIAEVAIAQLRKPSSEYSTITADYLSETLQ
jgi:excisionase family DNA binding protein